MASDPSTGHTWRFFRAGGFDQVRLDSGADLKNLKHLDQKLWVALSCPTQGTEIDSKTLELIDTDKDGRIRPGELLSAVDWACSMVKNPDLIARGGDSMPLDAINDATDEGRRVLASARQILINLGKGDQSSISVADTMDTVKIFAQTQFNGDGIVPVDAAENEAIAAVLTDIIACMGSQTDRSGKPGVNQATVDGFFAEAKAFSDWWATAQKGKEVMPLGEATAGAYDRLKAVRAKIDDFFARCELAAFDARAQAALNLEETAYLTIAAKDLTITSTEIAGLPLAKIAAGAALPLSEKLNPAWAGAIAALRDEVVRPLLGERPSLTESEWAALTGTFTGYEKWCAGKAGTVVEKLGLPRVNEILTGGAQAAINKLLEKDKALEPQANSIAAVDKLVRYFRDMPKVLNNFIAFRDFYGRKEKASFQAGTLYLDQRSCDLCIRVADAGRHTAMAHRSQMYLAYCDVTRKATGEKMSIVAAFTAGDSDNLMAGRNGIFYDRAGKDWDATIVSIVDNPISIRQAFWAPYKRVLRWIEDQVAKRAAAADAASTGKLTSAAEAAGTAATTGKAPEKPKFDVGVVAALGVAVGGITAALGALLQAFFGLGIWMPIGLVALVLLISGPSMLIAYLKLRQRNLGPILDANGWAVNAQAKINLPFGRSLTQTAVFPPGAKRDLTDPYAEDNSAWRRFKRRVILLVLLIAAAWGCWYFGVFERLMPGVLPQSQWLKEHPIEKKEEPAPAVTPPTAPATPAPPKAPEPAPAPKP